jgi:hypothetical protein
MHEIYSGGAVSLCATSALNTQEFELRGYAEPTSHPFQVFN